MKKVRVRLNRVLDPIDGRRREPGYETMLPETLATQWAKNGRITILGKESNPARPKAGAADPTQAPPAGSPAGSGAQSSSRPRGHPRKNVTLTSSDVQKPPAS